LRNCVAAPQARILAHRHRLSIRCLPEIDAAIIIAWRLGAQSAVEDEDWRPRPLDERKARLQKLLTEARAGIQFSQHLEGDGATIFAHACKLGLEGIVSKHREHPYRSGPSKVWLKIKNPTAPGVMRFEDRT
jgi:hypothetical protein